MSKLIVDGNEVFPGTITIIDNNSTITPKDNLRVILNISGESTVTLSDGTDVTQRVEVFNASNDNCTLSYVSSAGNSTTVLAKNTSIRLLWVGTFWDYSDATTLTGIDDNGQPFAYNIDSLVEPKGVINITGKDANGNPFDYGLGRLVTNADEDNLVSGVEVKTSKTLNGKPVYKMLYLGSLNSSKNYIANVASLNISRFANLWWCIDRGTSITFLSHYAGTSDYNRCFYTASTITIDCGSAYAEGDAVTLIFEYTKTTD